MNSTLLTYAAVIVIGGAILGLTIYFIASQARDRYAYSQYSNTNSQYANSRMGGIGGAQDFDLMGLITTAFNYYQKLNEEEE